MLSTAAASPIVLPPELRQPNGPAPDIPFNESLVPTVANVLTVNGTSGLITSWKNADSMYTTVKVTGFTPGIRVNLSQKGIAADRLMFQDQIAMSTGVVEFPYVRLTISEYVVRAAGLPGTTPGSGQFILFNTHPLIQSPTPGLFLPFVARLFMADHTQNWNTQNNPNPQSQSSCYPDYQWELVDERHMFAPVLIAHAPYGGTGWAGTGWTQANMTVVGPLGWSTTSESQSRLDTYDGYTAGEFQHIFWGLYEGDDRWDCPGYPNIVHTTRAIEVYNSYIGLDIYGPSRTTDRDDDTTIGDSLDFDYRYKTSDVVYDQSGTQADLTVSVTNQNLASFGGSASFNYQYGGVAVDVGLTISYKSQESAESYYQYVISGGSYIRADNYAWSGMKAFCAPAYQVNQSCSA
jgi:hypothetical protein